MSDEPKKRSRAWIWWALILMFVLYPLSTGPSMRLASSSDSWLQFHSIVFEPLFWVSEQSETIDTRVRMVQPRLGTGRDGRATATRNVGET